MEMNSSKSIWLIDADSSCLPAPFLCEYHKIGKYVFLKSLGKYEKNVL